MTDAQKQHLFDWINLGADPSVRLVVAQSNRRDVLILVNGDRVAGAASSLGFIKSKQGVWFTMQFTSSAGGLDEIPLDIIRSVFPNAAIEAMPVSQIFTDHRTRITLPSYRVSDSTAANAAPDTGGIRAIVAITAKRAAKVQSRLPATVYAVTKDYSPANGAHPPVEIKLGADGRLVSLATYVYVPEQARWQKDLAISFTNSEPAHGWLNGKGALSAAEAADQFLTVAQYISKAEIKAGTLDDLHPDLMLASDMALNQTLLNTAQQMGRNHRGEAVLDLNGTRFVAPEGTTPIRETSAEGGGRFLRVRTQGRTLNYADLYACAKAYVERTTSDDPSARLQFVDDIAPTMQGLDAPTMRKHLQRVFNMAVDVALAMQASSVATDAELAPAEAAAALVDLTRRQSADGQVYAPIGVGSGLARLLRSTGNSSNTLDLSGRDPAFLFAAAQFGGATTALDPEFDLGDALRGIMIAAVNSHESISRQVSILEREQAPPLGVKTTFLNLTSGDIQARITPSIMASELRITRKDLAQAVSNLQAQSPASIGIYLLDGNGSQDELSDEERNFYQWVSDRANITSITTLDGDLFSAEQGTEKPCRRLLVISGAKDAVAPGVIPEIDRVSSLDQLIERVDEINSELAQQIDDKRLAQDLRIQELDQQPKEAPALQASYQSRTPGQAIATMAVPVNLADAHAKALNREYQRYGSPEQMRSAILTRLQIPQDSEVLAPHQIDAAALAIRQIDERSGFIIGDQTGTGKTRVLAAAIKASVLSGTPVLFLTERKDLFSTLWRELGMQDPEGHVRPMVINPDCDVLDAERNVALTGNLAETRKLLQDGIAEYRDPDGHRPNLIMATYSQFFSVGNDRADWLKREAPLFNLMLDESHNAAGSNSNISKNMESVISSARSVVYSSATYAKVAYNIRLYTRAIPSQMSTDKIQEILEVGGEPLQEAICAMLVEDGRLIRREQSSQDLEIEIIRPDSEQISRRYALAEEFAEAVSILATLNEEAGRFFGKLSSAAMEGSINAQIAKKRISPLTRFSGGSIGSKLYSLTKHFLLACKPDLVAERAKMHLSSGRKPVIVIENTMGELLKTFARNANLLDSPDLLDRADAKLNNDAPEDGTRLSRQPLLSDIFRLAVLDMMTVTMRTDKLTVPPPPGSRKPKKLPPDTQQVSLSELASVVAHSQELTSDLASLRQSMKKAIEHFASMTPLPVSPIEDTVNLLHGQTVKLLDGTEKTLKVGELTRRTHEIIYEEDGSYTVRKRPQASVVQVVDAFNSGDLDVLLINRSAASGVDLHSSRDFLDQRQRVLLEMQVMENITDRLQVYGRLNRLNQVLPPRIENMSSGLVVEERVFAMQNKKIRRISAQTTSNQKNALLTETFDMLNPVGNKAAAIYLSNNPATARALSMDVSTVNDTITVRDMSTKNEVGNLMGTVLARMAMIKPKPAEVIYRDITSVYSDLLNDLTSAGANPLETHSLSGEIRIVERDILSGATAEGSEDVSAFDQPVTLTIVERKQRYRSYSAAEIIRTAAFNSRQLDTTAARRGLCDPGENAMAGIARKLTLLRKSEGDTLRSQRLSLLPFMQPGNIVFAAKDNFSHPQEMVIVSAALPTSLSDSGSFNFPLTLLAPGSKPIKSSLSHLMFSLTGLRPLGKTLTSDHPLAAEFERKLHAFVKTREVLIDGNLFTASMIASGLMSANADKSTITGAAPVIYRTQDGIRRRGIRLKGNESLISLAKSLPLPIPHHAIAAKLLDHRGKRIGTGASPSSGRDVFLDYARDGNDKPDKSKYRLLIPDTSRGAAIEADPFIVMLLGPQAFHHRATATTRFALVEPDMIDAVTGALAQIGYHFYRKHAEREWADAQMKSLPCAETPLETIRNAVARKQSATPPDTAPEPIAA